MARIKIIVTDDNGVEINTHAYDLQSDLTNLRRIESAVEGLRPVLLGDVTQDLLNEEQKAFTKKETTKPTAITPLE
jgi:hypothetical protein